VGDIIAYIKSNAAPDAVLLFENHLRRDENFLGLRIGSLGDLEGIHNEIVNASVALSNFHTNKTFDVQIDQLNKQVFTYQKLSLSLIKQQKLINQELALAREKFRTDSILFLQKVTSAIDFNAARTTWLQQQRNARNAETALINNEAQLNQLSKQIADTEIQKLEQGQKLELAVQQARQGALAQISKWKESYLFVSSTSGVLSYLGFLENEQFIEPGKPYFSVVPQGGKLLARAELPLAGSGKVKVGQGVNIRLENYPFEQFGMLHGEVASISLMPGADKYWVTISLPGQMLTSQNKTLQFKQQLTGTTEIITEDLRLMERFFYQFRKLINVR
jgi:HlyD family secretion protein